MKATAGLSFVHKNKIRKFRSAGHTVDEIAYLVNCSVELVQKYLLHAAVKIEKGSEGSREGENEFQRMLQAANMDNGEALEVAPDVHADNVESGGWDQHGPLQGSADWNTLTPGEKGQLTKKRNAA